MIILNQILKKQDWEEGGVDWIHLASSSSKRTLHHGVSWYKKYQYSDLKMKRANLLGSAHFTVLVFFMFVK
jgi:hypothetical protein